jgi:preprotein translocase subunit SecA
MSDAAAVRPGHCPGPYPERVEATLSWLDETGERLAHAVARRVRRSDERPAAVAARVLALEPETAALDDAALAREAASLGAAMRRDGFAEDLVVRSFALVREAAGRTIGLRHHDVQVRGGWVLLCGMVAEMETGEGKTLTATLAAATAALAGLPVHVISVNDYLVARDAEDMGPVYRALGLEVGVIQQSMQADERRAQYASDVTYVANNEVAFDYLKDLITLGRMRSRVRLGLEQLAHGESRSSRLILRGLCFGVVDEADSVLADEARTPLILSAGGDLDEFEEQVYEQAIRVARALDPRTDFQLDLRERQLKMTEVGEERVRVLSEGFGGPWRGPYRRRAFASQALSALHLFERDKHYLLHEGKVQIIDEYTGRRMPDRTWQRGLHQLIEAKEGVEITGHNEVLASISYQHFFRRYLRLAGMTGTAKEVEGELFSVYRMPVVRIPTNKPLRRSDLGTRVYARAEDKWRAIVRRIRELHEAGRPVLVGTRSVDRSEHLSALLDAEGLAHRVLNARQDAEEAEIVAQAGGVGCITVATNMAGRGTDIRLAPESLRAGGLHVIATERHESARIDRQLFGRCARQGDPGSFEVLVALDDDLMQAQGQGLAFALLQALAAAKGEEAASRASLRRLAVRLAQRRAERLHASMRRSLLSVDEQLSSMLAFSGRGE